MLPYKIMNGEYNPNETAKTSLLIIASIFTAVGGGMLGVNILTGSVLLLIAVGVLVLRGYLKKKQII